ncbi:hypothetical protein [Blastococcus deserti]|uniref:Uncharacterized protein n=1 Tax=Blastococcus deserti TaxID=2259033 RepID=A0ABW4X4D9_9ACTN
MPEPPPVPPSTHRLPADVAARIRTTAAPPRPPRRTTAVVLPFVLGSGIGGGGLAHLIRVGHRYRC